MPLNKLDNFIKNTEGRILYVNPSDLDSTDSITNEGNSLAQPFKTVQRALIEAARFSFLKGSNSSFTSLKEYPDFIFLSSTTSTLFTDLETLLISFAIYPEPVPIHNTLLFLRLTKLLRTDIIFIAFLLFHFF